MKDNLSNIPTELRKLDQWVVWRRGTGKNSKRPLMAVNGKPADSSDPSTWVSFEQAQEAVLEGRADGVGFVLSEGDPFTFIDLDKVIREGKIETWAKELVQRFNSYTEISQSGTGIHILIKAKKPGARSKSERVEVYSKDRYFALTGDIWEGSPLTIQDRQSELSQLYNEVFTDGAVHDDTDVRKLMSVLKADPEASPPKSKLQDMLDNDQFRATYERRRAFPSSSEYDMSLATLAVRAGWSNQQIADLIISSRRGSGDKDDFKKALRLDYLARTIIRARSREVAERSCELTDVGNARRLVLRHGENLRYCHPLKKWLIWDTIRWKVDDIGQIVEITKETLRSIYHQAASIKEDAKRSDLIKAVRRHENCSRVKAMIELAQSESDNESERSRFPDIPVLPRQLDTDPWKFNVLNGTIDLMTGKLLGHDREDLITKLAPVEYVPDAQSDLWGRLLERALPDEDVRGFVQRLAGYTLYGRNSENKLLLVYGPPASGKSTFITVISAAMGDYVTVADFGTFKKRRWQSGGSPTPEIAKLVGARMVTSFEVQGELDEEMINQLTGEDEVSARGLYMSSFSFLPMFTPWMVSNYRPSIDSPEGGFWRRIHEIPFDQVIPEHERDTKLKQRLCEPKHKAAVLSWLVKGCLEWQERGLLDVPDIVKEATRDYQQEMDHVKDFLEECTITGGSCYENVTALNNVYKEWCRRSRHNPLGRKSFNANLSQKGFNRVRSRDGLSWQWDGIQLNAEADDMTIMKIRVHGKQAYP